MHPRVTSPHLAAFTERRDGRGPRTNSRGEFIFQDHDFFIVPTFCNPNRKALRMPSRLWVLERTPDGSLWTSSKVTPTGPQVGNG